MLLIYPPAPVMQHQEPVSLDMEVSELDGQGLEDRGNEQEANDNEKASMREETGNQLEEQPDLSINQLEEPHDQMEDVEQQEDEEPMAPEETEVAEMLDVRSPINDAETREELGEDVGISGDDDPYEADAYKTIRRSTRKRTPKTIFTIEKLGGEPSWSSGTG